MTTTASTQRRLGGRVQASALIRRHALSVSALGVFACLTVIAFFPLVTNVRSATLFEPGDITSTARDYWAAAESGKTPFTFVHDDLLWAPQGQERATSLQWANPATPAFVVAFEPVVGYLGALNLYLLLGFTLTGFAMFVLLRRLRMRVIAAFFGASVFAFNWWQYEQAFYGHIGLNHLWIFPVLLIALLRLRRMRTRSAAIVAGLVIGLAFYLFSYLGLFACLLTALFAVLDMALRPRAEPLRHALVTHGAVWVTAYAALFPALAAAVLFPSGFASSFTFSKESFFGARLADYLIPSAHHPFLGDIVDSRGWPPSHVGEAVVFFGYSTILLAVIGIASSRRRRARDDEPTFMRLFALLLVPVAALMSLPAYFVVAGERLPLPNAAFVIGTFTNWWKIYSRFSVLVALGLAILAAAGIEALLRRRRGALAVAAFLIVAVFEMLPGTPVPTWSVTESGTTPLVRWLADQPKGTVAHYPMAQTWLPLARRADEWSSHTWQAVFDQTRHGQPLFAVPSLPMTGGRDEAIRLLAMDLERPDTASLLASQSVKYVVVNEDMYRHLDMEPPTLGHGFQQLVQIGPNSVYEVLAGEANVDALLMHGADVIVKAQGRKSPGYQYVDGFHGAEDYFGTRGRWMIQDGELFVPAPTLDPPSRHRIVLRAFSSRVRRRLDLLDETGTVKASIIVTPRDEQHILGPFDMNEPTRLRLRATPGPAPLGPPTDNRVGSVFIVFARVDLLPY